jgi:putative endonuclease
MLLCIDGSYYVGLTNDLSQRVHDHAYGKGSPYTKRTKPVALVWYEIHPNRETAAAREKQLKGWNRTKKHALVRGELRLGPSTRGVRLSLN